MKLTLFVLFLCSVYSMPSQATMGFSDDLVADSSSFKSMVGRGMITHLHNGSYAASSPQREAHVMAVRKHMEDEILGVGAFVNQGDTPPIEFISAMGVNESYVFHTKGSGPTQSILKVANVQKSTKPGEGFLNGTLLLPASGHTGAASAHTYAATDTYTIRFSISTDAQGTQFTDHFGDAGSLLINNAKSLGLVTLHEVSIPVMKNRVTRIYYFRSGSGGPGGYFDGRVIDFVPSDINL